MSSLSILLIESFLLKNQNRQAISRQLVLTHEKGGGLMNIRNLLLALAFSTATAGQAAVLQSANTHLEGETLELAYDIPIDWTTRSALDLLFVIDDSGSMNVHQQRLSEAIKPFVGSLPYNEIRAAVISTSPENVSPSFNRLGSRISKIINVTKDGIDELQEQIVEVGVMGAAIEMPLGSLFTALDENSVTSDFNREFINSQNDLGIFILTDADDQSELEVAAVYRHLVDLKGDPEKLKMVFAGVLSPTNKCRADMVNGMPDRLLQLTQALNDSSVDLCSTDFSDQVSRVATEWKPSNENRPVGQELVINLPTQPDLQTLSVFYGNQEIPRGVLGTGWFYNSADNTVIIAADVILDYQAEDTRLRLRYRSAQ